MYFFPGRPAIFSQEAASTASNVRYRSFSHWFSYHWGWLLGIAAVDQFLIDFTLTPDDCRYQDTYANHLKLLAHIQAGECRLCLMEDPEGFQSATGALQYLDGTIPSESDHYECAGWERIF